LVTLIETLPLIFERFTLKNPLAGFGETATAGSDCSVFISAATTAAAALPVAQFAFTDL